MTASPVIVCVIGGPTCRLQSSCVDVQQVPCTLDGLAHLTSLHDADIVVYWPTPYLFHGPTVLSELASAARLLRSDDDPIIWGLGVSHGVCPEDNFLMDRDASPFSGLADDFTKQLHFAASCRDQARTHGFPLTEYRRRTGYGALERFICDVLVHVLRAAWHAAEHGAVVLAVVPRDFVLNDEHRQDPELSGVAHAFDWISPQVAFSASTDLKTVPGQIKFGDTSERFAQAARCHAQFIDAFPFHIQLQPPVLPSKMSVAKFTACRDVRGKVKVVAGVRNNRGQAKSLVIRYHQGGIILMPEPRNPEDMLYSLLGAAERRLHACSPEMLPRQASPDDCLQNRLPKDEETLKEWNARLRFKAGPFRSLQDIAAYIDSLDPYKKVDSTKERNFVAADGKVKSATPDTVRKKLEKRLPQSDVREGTQGMASLPDDLKAFLRDALVVLRSRITQR